MKNIDRLARSDRANAFIAEPGTRDGPVSDDLAEYLGENFVSSATGAEDAEDAEDVLQDGLDVENVAEAAVETDASAFGGDMEEETTNKPGQRHSDKAAGVVKRAPSKPAIRTFGTAPSPLGSNRTRSTRARAVP
jgi:hypothetical protein